MRRPSSGAGWATIPACRAMLCFAPSPSTRPTSFIRTTQPVHLRSVNSRISSCSTATRYRFPPRTSQTSRWSRRWLEATSCIKPKALRRGDSLLVSQSQIISVSDNHGGTNQQEQGQCQQPARLHSRAFPLLQPDAPQAAEDDDAGHVQCPTREFVFTHLGFAHRIKEELKIPGSAGQGAQQIIREHWNPCAIDT